MPAPARYQELGREIEVRARPGLHQEQFEVTALNDGPPVDIALRWLEDPKLRSDSEESQSGNGRSRRRRGGRRGRGDGQDVREPAASAQDSPEGGATLEEPAPEVAEEPAPEIAEEPAPEVAEEPAAEVAEEPTPAALETPEAVDAEEESRILPPSLTPLHTAEPVLENGDLEGDREGETEKEGT